jgi:hypothetical protein
MRYAFFILLLALPQFAVAAAPSKDAKVYAACEDPASLETKIHSCTDNVIAEKAATACRDALVAEWVQANAQLSSVMSVSKKNLDTKQQADFSNSHSDMQLAIDRLASLIILTEDSADKLAQYPRIMFDNPYAASGLEGSSNCYKQSFLAIGKVVKDLDKKADEGEDALAATDKLRGVSQARDDGIGTSLSHSVATGHQVGIGAGTPKTSASDVTGLEQDKAKQRGASESGGTATLSAARFSAKAVNAPAANATAAKTFSPPPAAPVSFSHPGLGAKIDPSGTFSARGPLSTGAAAQVGDAQVPASSGDVGISSETNLLNTVIPGMGSAVKGEESTDPRVPASPDKTKSDDAP